MDSHLPAIFLHLLPVLGYFALRPRELAPGNRWPPGRFFNHVNTVFHGTHVIAEAAANTIFFTHMNAGTQVYGIIPAIRLKVIRLRLDYAAIPIDQVDALVGRVVAGDVAEIAANAFLLVDARYGTKRQVKAIDVADAVEAAAHDGRDTSEHLFVHPVRQPVPRVCRDPQS